MADRNTTLRLAAQVTTCLGVLGGYADNPFMDFRANLRRIRRERGLTQEGLAELCGWGQSRISNYEIPTDREGSRTPDVDDAVILAKALNVPIQELYGEQSQPAKLDPETMASALKLTEAMEYGKPKGDFRMWAKTLIFVYGRVAAGGQAGMVDQILEAATERREAKGEGNDGSNKSGPRKR